MKIIIAGSRDLYPTFELIHSSLVLFGINKLITEVICGGAEGVDTEGDYYASHMALSVKYFPADWNEHGKAAGPRRNKEMADYSDALLLIWDGKSTSLR